MAASTYTTNLKLELIPTGSQAGIWGATTNVNLGSSTATQSGLEQAIVGMATLVTADFVANVATYTLSNSNAYQVARAFVLDITATLTAAGTVNVPAIQKPYLVFNNSVGGFAVTVKVSGQTGVSVPNGSKAWLYNNGTDVGAAFNYAPSLSLGSALLTTSGGTGQIAYTAGDLTYYASGTALTKLAIGTSTFLLTSSGTAPQWTNPTSVTVGTATTATNIAGGAANRVVFQSGASTTSFVAAPVTIGTVLGWTGTAFDWVSAPAASTATNLAGGAQYQIPFQSGVNTTTFNANLTFDSATNTFQTASITTTGAITAPQVGSIIPFYFASTLPTAGATNHGAVAHLHSTGKLYYSHSNAWQIITSGLGTADTAGTVTPVGSSGQLLTNNGQGGLTSNTTGTGVVTALGVNVGSSGAFVPQSGALTQYGVIYAPTTTTLATTAAGTAGYVLTANASAAPTFQALPASGVSAIELFFYANANA